MDEPKAKTDGEASAISDTITLTPDMRPLGPEKPEGKPQPVAPDTRSSAPPPRPAGRGVLVLGLLALLIGLGALGLSAWTYLEGQREVLRLSTELAQLRVSLDLYARNGLDAAEGTALAERLSALEDNAATATVPAPTTAVVPAAEPGAREDCLPVGMRLLVAAGDSYPICEQQAEVAISAVADGYITLSDGTSVASGGTMPLPANPACTIAVTSGGDEGLTGYAEIRVTC